MVKAAHTVMACCSMTFGQHQIVSVAQNNLNNIKSLSFSAKSGGICHLLATQERSKQRCCMRPPCGVRSFHYVRPWELLCSWWSERYQPLYNTFKLTMPS